jgi:hypothetical protein
MRGENDCIESRMLVPANVGFQEDNLAPEGLKRVINDGCREGRLSGSENG